MVTATTRIQVQHVVAERWTPSVQPARAQAEADAEVAKVELSPGRHRYADGVTGIASTRAIGWFTMVYLHSVFKLKERMPTSKNRMV